MHRTWRLVFNLLSLAVITALLLGAPGVTPASAAPGDTTLVSVDSGGTLGNNDSTYPSISADGRYVAFRSRATNLVAVDTNGFFDIFVHDRTSNLTTLVSVGPGGVQANRDSSDPSISADGRYVAFYTYANNLVAGDTNASSDIFVHDRTTGTTTLVSPGFGGTQGDADSFDPSISADGRYVAFRSYAGNLVAVDTNGWVDIFVHDRITGLTTLVSVGPGGVQGDDNSYHPFISPDGLTAVFGSYASNLVTGDTNGFGDVFVHDLVTGATTRLSVDSTGNQGNNHSYSPSISADGRYVAFRSNSSNLVAVDTNGFSDVFVHDRTTGATTLVSVGPGGVQATSNSYVTSISADGRFVAFYSNASNLVAVDTNWSSDVFVHDRTNGLTKLVSLDSSGVQANSNSYEPSISADGRYTSFYSLASNLAVGDTNALYDVYVHEMDTTAPTVLLGAGTVPANASLLAVGPTQIIIEYNKDVLADGSAKAANNTANYLLVEDGADNAFTSASCALPDLVGDTQIPVNTAAYTNNSGIGPFLATLGINSGVPLPDGTYRLFICGTTSVYDLSGNRLNNGADSVLNFRVGAAAPAAPAAPAAMPDTGFAPGAVTILPPQAVAYAASDLVLEIPRLGLKMDILGVPQVNGAWDVSWLGGNAGWLQGTAFPTWDGNSVLTAHVWNADNSAGPFVYLNTLWYGDQIIVHAWGQDYLYEVRTARQVRPDDTRLISQHEDLPWLTLVTCRGYDAATGTYRSRVVVRAVQVGIR